LLWLHRFGKGDDHENASGTGKEGTAAEGEVIRVGQAADSGLVSRKL